jgi:hypothetical protein
MSHSVSVFIAGEPAIRKLSASLGNAPYHHIRNDGWFFLPVTDEVFDLATSLKGDSDPVREGYYRFSKSLALIAGEGSDAGPIAHVFTTTLAAKEPRAPPSGKPARSSCSPTSTASAPSTPPSAPSASLQQPPWTSSTPSAWEA